MVELFRESEFSQVYSSSLVENNIIQSVLRASRENEINPAMKALALDVQSKVIIFLSTISNNKICDAFLRTLAEGDVYTKIYSNAVGIMLDEVLRGPTIEYQGEMYPNKLEQDLVD